MAFAGDLEHLPIVDVIQLLHSTRKSGTLCLSSQKGESQLVFQDGYIVSANHANNSIRIGQILVDMGLITRDQLEQALEMQSGAGARRKPLIATLIESRQLKKEDAYKGLENLIEMSIVDILSWTSGSFRLSIDSDVISDEYRYFPETLKQDILMNTQGILMDALRIYDEKMRDGSLNKGAFASEAPQPVPATGPKPVSGSITADILGLEDLDNLEKKVPDVYMGLKDYNASEAAKHLDTGFPDNTDNEQSRIISCLKEFSGKSGTTTAKPSETASSFAVIIFSQDDFITRIITTICKYNGLPAFSTDNSLMLAELIDQQSLENHAKLIVFDAPQPAEQLLNEENILSVIQNYCEDSKSVSTIQLTGENDHDFSVRALLAGADSILPRPLSEDSQIVFGKSTVDFLKIFQQHLTRLINHHNNNIYTISC